MSSGYRGRLAPSPTGLLHLGHARTFAMAAERARGGALVLRNEDLDLQRSRPEFVQAIVEDLRWLGLSWNEGPDIGGLYAPYTQSERREQHHVAWLRLMEAGLVYPCFCSRRELRESAAAEHVRSGGELSGDEDELLYSGRCRTSRRVEATPEIRAGVNWRFRVPDGEAVTFRDGRYGDRCYVAGSDFGDFLVWRRDDVPSYQLACVVDDAAMGITEVVRGADLLISTARQLLLYRALGLVAPAWFHCPLVTDAAGVRLAKRTGGLSIRALRERGCSPEEVMSLGGPCS